eukprot:GHRR01015027.1.p2 GENE.GHRR01015027.1~~GHRR01015027.1.p2  ORF type:complete len:133 (-),score=32.59 GHRR01015027.1:1738-2136(-)
MLPIQPLDKVIKEDASTCRRAAVAVLYLQVKQALWDGGIARSNKPIEKSNTPGLNSWSDLVRWCIQAPPYWHVSGHSRVHSEAATYIPPSGKGAQLGCLQARAASNSHRSDQPASIHVYTCVHCWQLCAGLA